MAWDGWIPGPFDWRTLENRDHDDGDTPGYREGCKYVGANFDTANRENPEVHEKQRYLRETDASNIQALKRYQGLLLLVNDLRGLEKELLLHTTQFVV